MVYEAKRVMNGTYGEVWFEGEYVAEVTGFQAKVTFKKEVVSMAGDPMEHQKVMGMNGTGSIEMNKVNSRFINKLDKMKKGQTVYFDVISKLDDPDSYGAERIAFGEVSFDDLTLADWKSATKGLITAPFTFASYELLETIKEL